MGESQTRSTLSRCRRLGWFMARAHPVASCRNRFIPQRHVIFSLLPDALSYPLTRLHHPLRRCFESGRVDFGGWGLRDSVRLVGVAGRAEGCAALGETAAQREPEAVGGRHEQAAEQGVLGGEQTQTDHRAKTER